MGWQVQLGFESLGFGPPLDMAASAARPKQAKDIIHESVFQFVSTLTSQYDTKPEFRFFLFFFF